MHPAVTADHAGRALQRLRRDGPRAPRGLVSARRARSWRCRESAVVDAGARKVVFVETMPGMFDGVEVVLGPRCGDFYPVVRGLEAARRSRRRGLSARRRDAAEPEPRRRLLRSGPRRAHDRSPVRARSRPAGTAAAASSPCESSRPRIGSLAERQKLCPVTSKPLGSMGTPARVVVAGQVVFLCCDGCEDALEARARQVPGRSLPRLTNAHDRRDHHLLDPPPRPGHRRQPASWPSWASGPPGTRRSTRFPTCRRTRSSSSPTGRGTARARSRTR